MWMPDMQPATRKGLRLPTPPLNHNTKDREGGGQTDTGSERGSGGKEPSPWKSVRVLQTPQLEYGESAPTAGPGDLGWIPHALKTVIPKHRSKRKQQNKTDPPPKKKQLKMEAHGETAKSMHEFMHDSRAAK